MEVNERATPQHGQNEYAVWAVPVQQHPEASGIGMSDQAEITAPGSAPDDPYADRVMPPPFSPLRAALGAILDALPPDTDLSTILTEEQRSLVPDLLSPIPASKISEHHGIRTTRISELNRLILQQLIANERTAPYVPEDFKNRSDAALPEPLVRSEPPLSLTARIAEGKAAFSAAHDGQPPSWACGQPGAVLRALLSMQFDIARYVPERQVQARMVLQQMAAGAKSHEIAEALNISSANVGEYMRRIADVIVYTVPRDELPPDFPVDMLTPRGTIE